MVTSHAPFWLLFWVRSHLGRDRLLTVLTVFASATSVALAVGLEMSSRSVELELQHTANVLAGAAQLEVTGGDAGIPEEILDQVAEVPGVASTGPLIEVTLRLREGPKAGSSLHVLGVDLLSDPDVRSYRYHQGAIESRNALSLIAGIDAVIVTRGLADALDLGIGDPLEFDSEGGPLTLRVQGILADGGVADAFGGHLVLMDVYALQTLLGRRGWLDRIDVVVEAGADLAQVHAAIEGRLEGKASVRRAARRDAWVENTVAAIRFVIWALVAVGVLVASLLTYATISLSVNRRAAQFALLRAAGLEARRVRRLVVAEALVFGTLASLAGLLMGSLLAGGFVSILSTLSAYLQDVEIERLEMTPVTIAIAFAVGVGVGVLGSLEPAVRVASRAPLEVLAAQRPAGFAARRRYTWVYAALGAVWLVLVLVPPPIVGPLVRLGLIFAIGLVGIALAARDLFAPVVRGIRPLLERALPGVGRLAGSSLLARPFHSAIAVATVAGVVAGVAIVLVLVSSLSETLDDWTAGQYPGAIYVVAGNPLGGSERDLIPPDVVKTVEGTPGVLAVFDHFTTNVIYEGEEVLLGASSMAVMAEHGRLPVVVGEEYDVASRLADGEIAVSDAFAGHFGVAVGSTIELNTPKGRLPFRVAGMIRDYAGPSGSLNIDLSVYDRLWTRTGSNNLVIWADEPIEPVLDAIRTRAGPGHDLFFIYGEELERYASTIVGQFTVLLDVVAILTAIIGGVAVMNLLLGAVVERRRELALLRAAGSTSAQLGGLILLDGAILSVTGAVTGIALGLVCAYPMVTEVVRTAFSWWILFVVNPWEMLGLGLAVIVASLAAGLWPALQTRSMVPREALAPE